MIILEVTLFWVMQVKINFKKFKVPEGETYYVLRRDKVNNKSEFWNPQTGDPYYLSSEPNINKFFGITIGNSKQTVLDEFDQVCYVL